PFTNRRSVVPSHVVATWVQTFAASAVVPLESNLPPAGTATPAGTKLSLDAYRPYTRSPGFSLTAIVRHAALSAVGLTHASSVNPFVRSSDAESGTVTQLE